MSLIIPLIILFALLILGLSFVRYKFAIVLYVSYMILVGYSYINLPVWSFSYISVNIVLLGAFIFNFKIKNDMSLDFSVIKPFLLLFASLFFITLFADMASSSYQFRYWRLDFMRTCILAFIIWNVSINDEKFIKNVKWSLIISILIAGTYAILIMRLGGANPYTSFLSSYFGSGVDYSEFYTADYMTRIRNQGTMNHPMAWVLYLSAFCVFFLTLFLKERKRLYLFLLCFVAFNIVIANVRTGIAASGIALAYIYIRYNKINIKTIFYGTAIVVIVALFVAANEELSQRFLSLIDVSGTKTDVEGSSFEMRLNQFNGCLDEISNSVLFGNGYAWTTHYMSKNIEHPVILMFESLIYVVLCNHGIAGVVIWLIFAVMLFKVPRKILKIKKNVYCVDGLVIFFFTYTIGTGLYDYLAPFALFYSFLLGYLYNDEKREINLL